MGMDDKRRWGLRRSGKKRSVTGLEVAGRSAPAPTLDLGLIVLGAPPAGSTRAASRTLFARHLEVTPEVADLLLARLEHCEVLAPAAPGQMRRVIPTTAELPAVVAEFERRHRDG